MLHAWGSSADSQRFGFIFSCFEWLESLTCFQLFWETTCILHEVLCILGYFGILISPFPMKTCPRFADKSQTIDLMHSVWDGKASSNIGLQKLLRSLWGWVEWLTTSTCFQRCNPSTSAFLWFSFRVLNYFLGSYLMLTEIRVNYVQGFCKRCYTQPGLARLRLNGRWVSERPSFHCHNLV